MSTTNNPSQNPLVWRPVTTTTSKNIHETKSFVTFIVSTSIISLVLIIICVVIAIVRSKKKKATKVHNATTLYAGYTWEQKEELFSRIRRMQQGRPTKDADMQAGMPILLRFPSPVYIVTVDPSTLNKSVRTIRYHREQLGVIADRENGISDAICLKHCTRFKIKRKS